MPSTTALAMMAMPICMPMRPRDQAPDEIPVAGDFAPYIEPFSRNQPHDGPSGGREGKELNQRGEERRLEGLLGRICSV